MKTIPRRTLLQALVVSGIALTSPISAQAADTQSPKLIVTMVVDGLPNEQIMRYRNQFGEGGFRRFLQKGAAFGDAHQAHGVTVTAVGHSALLTGAYPYRHGIIANEWIDRKTLKSVYCTEDTRYTYIGEETKPSDGTSPANLKVSTLGDELRYATGGAAKVISISGKDRGAILPGGKAGTAYMYMGKSGNFASTTYYMPSHPAWVTAYNAKHAQDRYYGQQWQPLLPATAYASDEPDPQDDGFPLTYASKSGKPDAEYYGKLPKSPFLDELTLDFARAAVEAEQLGRNPAGVPDLLAVSLSAHDYVNHAYGPESRMSHDHLQRLDRMLAQFFAFLDQKVGLENTVVMLTADHGFPNTPEYSRKIGRDADRIDSKKMMEALNQHLNQKFGVTDLAAKFSHPNVLLNDALIEQKKLSHEQVENAAASFLLDYPGISQAFTRTQLEPGELPKTREAVLMQRGWNRQISGDVMLVSKPFWYFGSSSHGTSHGSPYTYDTNVPLLFMGAPWIKPGYYPQYAEVADIAPTLAYLLRVRPPAASEGRVLQEMLRAP